MKRFLLTILLLSLLKGSTAQDNWYALAFPDSLFSRVKVSLLAGPDKNKHVVDMMYADDIRYMGLGGWTAGVSATYQLKGWAALRADLSYVQKNYMMYRMGYKVNDMHTETTNDYLTLPVVAQFSVGQTFRAFGFFGGYVGYWLRSHREGFTMSMDNIIYGDTEGGSFDEDVKFSTVRDNRLDYGLVYGGGLACTLMECLDISFEVRCLYGLSDIQKNYMRDLNPRYNTTTLFQVGVGYWL